MNDTRTRLLWLALGAFAIGTESYALAGLLPALSSELGVSVAMAGQLITAFALAYALGSPLLAVATAAMERRSLLLTAIAVFGAFNLLAASAHTYAVLFVARIGMALAAGTFMPAASAYAVAISPVERRGRALSIIYAGLTFATVIGVPVGVLVGERLGWRSIFLGAAGLAAIALGGLFWKLKAIPNPASVPLAERLAVARRPDILGALAVTVITLTGAFTIYSYLAPFLAESTGLTGDAVAMVLFLFGVGCTIGNLAAGVAADRIGPQRVLFFVVSGLIVLFSVLSLAAVLLPPATARWVIVPVVGLWGLLGFAFPAAQQARLVTMAPRLAPITISLNASAIYLGISFGALLGSVVVAHHWVARIGWVGAACDVIALGVLLYGARRAAAAKVAAEAATAESSDSLPHLGSPAKAA
jgi:predicted MFS family arabinose efflux permease